MIKPPAIPISKKHENSEYLLKSESSRAFSVSGNMRVFNIMTGAVSVKISDSEKTLFTGDSFILNPHEEAEMYALGATKYYCFIIDQVKLFDALCIPALTSFKSFIPKDTFIIDICRKMSIEYTSSPFHENMLNALVSELLIHLCRNYNKGAVSAPSSLLLGKHKIARLAVEYIYQNCVKGITTSEISAHINVSESYLCRCFKEATGVSILEYAERIRCRKAREDLALGIYTATQIAEKYNFNSLSYFSRRYKKYCGENPMDTLSEAKKRRSK